MRLVQSRRLGATVNANPLSPAAIPDAKEWFAPKTLEASASETASVEPSQPTDAEIDAYIATLAQHEAENLQQILVERKTARDKRELANKIIAEAERICRTAPRGTQGYVYESVIKALVAGQMIPAFWPCTRCNRLHDATVDPTLRCPTNEPEPDPKHKDETFEQRRRANSGELSFKYPAVSGTPEDCVIGPMPGIKTEGWFARGDVHLVGGPSGASKSTFMIDLLETQLKSEKFLGHETFGMPYLILMSDRGRFAHLRTAKRMRFDPDLIPIKFLPSVTGMAAAKAILAAIESAPVIPQIVFVEGCDMLMENASKMEMVVPFLDAIQKIAAHYHLALVGSVGSPKTKQGEGYVSKRDNLFGTVAWGRKTETIAVLQCHEGDDMSPRRNLSILLRNGPPEKYSLKLDSGRLVELAKEEVAPPEPLQVQWFKAQTDWFTSQDLQDGMGTSKATADRHIKSAYSKGQLKMKPGPNGGARLYRWNTGPAQPAEPTDTSAGQVEPAGDPLADVPETGL
jgi:hypothetical protein